MKDFIFVSDMDKVGQNVLEKRYLKENEKTWDNIIVRVCDNVIGQNNTDYQNIYKMLLYRYFIPNSPCLVNAGTTNGGLSACFVVDFTDSILGIYKTKLDFALIAKKGGGCGTTLSKIRPENSKVEGSTHGYAGGPIKFFDTICHDMKAMTQAGFREMAMMGTMSVYHPDIKKFIAAKTVEGKMHTTNISVVVDNNFMELVRSNGKYWTEFGNVKYDELLARDIFQMIVEGAWHNGEPGLVFDEYVNKSPYKETGQYIFATNPCGEQGLPPNGVCNLGSLDISKFFINGSIDWELLEHAVRLSARFLDCVIDINKFPTDDIDKWAKDNRPVGIGVMGIADWFLKDNVVYGSKKSLSNLEELMLFIKEVAYDESEKLGELYGIPKECKKLKHPRRNITLLSIAPTGSISLLSGCSNGIEPVFSELTQRKDKTGEYEIFHSYYQQSHFRCAVSANGAKEVTWQEHILVQNSAQKYVDAGVSKTINFPNKTRKETIWDAFIYAWELRYIKGLTVYRNGSREVEVLSPKNLKKDECPLCGANLIKESGCKHCSKCEFQLCEIA